MYVFYADESGFSKGKKFQPDQPITVFAGVLIDLSKLPKALRAFDRLLKHINEQVDLAECTLDELKFSAIKVGRKPYNQVKVKDRIALLTEIIDSFWKENIFKVCYCAIDDKRFFEEKKKKTPHADKLHHPYLAAAYRVISHIQHHQRGKHNNKGSTFLIFDQQGQYQERLEKLIKEPLHIGGFSQVIDTAYFGKSHYSKLIQIADLWAGLIRQHLTNKHNKREDKHWGQTLESLFDQIVKEAVRSNCFKGENPYRSYTIT